MKQDRAESKSDSTKRELCKNISQGEAVTAHFINILRTITTFFLSFADEKWVIETHKAMVCVPYLHPSPL